MVKKVAFMVLASAVFGCKRPAELKSGQNPHETASSPQQDARVHEEDSAPAHLFMTSAQATAASTPAFYGAQLQSQNHYTQENQRVRLTWRAKPAHGNCVVTLFSLFNAEKLFGTNQGHWSEIDFEIFGGAAGNAAVRAFQTQYITYNLPNDAPTTRGKQHQVFHYVGKGNVPGIFDNAFHDFQIEYQSGMAAQNLAEIVYRVDGKEIRRERNGDVKRLEAVLESYTAVWITAASNSWGCVTKDARPSESHVVVAEYKAEQLGSNGWYLLEDRTFPNARSRTKGFYLSDYGFDGFDGTYCSANVVWQNPSFVELGLQRSCSAANTFIDPITNKAYPYCASSASDPDRDGFGWENNQSCKVR